MLYTPTHPDTQDPIFFPFNIIRLLFRIYCNIVILKLSYNFFICKLFFIAQNCIQTKCTTANAYKPLNLLPNALHQMYTTIKFVTKCTTLNAYKPCKFVTKCTSTECIQAIKFVTKCTTLNAYKPLNLLPNAPHRQHTSH